MYQGKTQWARFIFAMFNIIVVYFLIQDEQIKNLLKWSDAIGAGAWLPITQLTLFIISIGLIFPKHKRLEIFKIQGKQATISNDWKWLVVGMFMNAAAWFMGMLR